jgi:hypothetical protein
LRRNRVAIPNAARRIVVAGLPIRLETAPMARLAR